MKAKGNRAATPVGKGSGVYTARELNGLRAVEADIHAGRITETDGTSLEDHMERATRRVARAMRSRA